MRACRALGGITCIVVGVGLFVVFLGLPFSTGCFDACQPGHTTQVAAFAAMWLGPGAAIAAALWLWERLAWGARAQRVWVHQPLPLAGCAMLVAALVFVALAFGAPPSQLEAGAGPYAIVLAAVIVGVWAFAVGWYGVRGTEYHQPQLWP